MRPKAKVPIQLPAASVASRDTRARTARKQSGPRWGAPVSQNPFGGCSLCVERMTLTEWLGAAGCQPLSSAARTDGRPEEKRNWTKSEWETRRPMLFRPSGRRELGLVHDNDGVKSDDAKAFGTRAGKTDELS